MAGTFAANFAPLSCIRCSISPPIAPVKASPSRGHAQESWETGAGKQALRGKLWDEDWEGKSPADPLAQVRDRT